MAVLPLGALLLAGCSASGLNFRLDTRLNITAPAPRTSQHLPVTVDWSLRTPEQTLSPGGFGVYVDVAPQPPGKPLSWFARNDRSCRSNLGCPDANYLIALGVYQTDAQSITLSKFRPPKISKRKERHTVTICYLDAQSHRIGESSFEVTFTLDRPFA